MIGSAMRKPRIQPGRGSASADSMIDGPDDRDRDVAPGLVEGPFAERLGERVRVRPADRRGPGPAGLGHAVVTHSTCGAARSWPASSGVPGGAELAVGPPCLKRRQQFRRPALGLEVDARPAGGVDLGPPVEVEVEGPLGQQLFGCRSPAVAGHVTGGHRDQMGPDVELVEHGDDPARTQQVDLDGRIQRRVEGHRRRRVDDEVAAGQGSPALVVEAETVPGDVAPDDRDPAGDLGLERRPPAELVAQAVEGVVAEDLPLGPLGRR